MATPVLVPWADGTYLTNGQNLFQVMDAAGREVLLEDAYTGKREWRTVKKLLCEMRVVRPEEDASTEGLKTQKAA